MQNLPIGIQSFQWICHDYALPFITDSRKLYKIGVNFSCQTRNIDSWLVAE